jgi:hypothetical protein
LLKSFSKYYKKELGPILKKNGKRIVSLMDLYKAGISVHTIAICQRIMNQFGLFLIALGKKAGNSKSCILISRERDCLRL